MMARPAATYMPETFTGQMLEPFAPTLRPALPRTPLKVETRQPAP
jgi:hypothetical protein